MKNQPDFPVRKSNRLAIISLVVGILAMLPYLPDLILILGYLLLGNSSTFERVRDLVLPVALIAGIIYKSVGFLFMMISISIIFSVTSLLISNKAIKQIRRGDNVEKGHGMAITARVVGILGMITNIGFGIAMFFALSVQ